MHMLYSDKLSARTRERFQSSAGGSILESDVVKGRLRAGSHRATIDAQRAEIVQLKIWKEKYTKKYKAAEEQIAELEDKIEDDSKSHREVLKKRDQRIRAMEDELAQTKGLLAARSTELSRAQSFLSTADRLSEAEVLGIVRDLNENVFQVAAKLAEEWEKSRAELRFTKCNMPKETVDAMSRSYGHTLIRHVVSRDPAAVAFLIQSCLCSLATELTSSWRHDNCEEPMALGTVYQQLLASEGQAITSKWRSLTHSSLPELTSQFDFIVEEVAQVLRVTGTFGSSPRTSIKFVKDVASSGIETIERLAMRLESVFMLDIASSDMYLFSGPSNSEFDETRMTQEFESGKASAKRKKDKVAGTTEVGVEKRVCKRKGEGQQVEVMLKVKVVLEGDLASS